MKTQWKGIFMLLLLILGACNQDEDIYEASEVEEQQTEEKLLTYEEVMKNGGILLDSTKTSYNEKISSHTVYEYDVNYKHYINQNDLEKHSRHDIKYLFDYIKKVNNGTECAYITINGTVIHNPKSEKHPYNDRIYVLDGKEYYPYFNVIPAYLRDYSQYLYLPKNRVQYNYYKTTKHVSDFPIADDSYVNCTSNPTTHTVSFIQQRGISNSYTKSTSTGKTTSTTWSGKYSANLGLGEFFKRLLPSLNVEASWVDTVDSSFEKTKQTSQSTDSFSRTTKTFSAQVTNEKGRIVVFKEYNKHTYKVWAAVRLSGAITYSLLRKGQFSHTHNNWYHRKYDLHDDKLSLSDYFSQLKVPLTQSKFLGYQTFEAPSGTRQYKYPIERCYW